MPLTRHFRETIQARIEHDRLLVPGEVLDDALDDPAQSRAANGVVRIRDTRIPTQEYVRIYPLSRGWRVGVRERTEKTDRIGRDVIRDRSGRIVPLSPRNLTYVFSRTAGSMDARTRPICESIASIMAFN